MTTILGINAFHGDSAACLSAMASWSRRPRKSASAASSTGRAFPARRSATAWPRPASAWREVEHVAVNQDAKANLGKKLAYTADKRPGSRPGAGPPPQQARARRASTRTWRAAFPGETFAGQVHAGGAPPGASVVGVSCVAVRGGGGRLGRRLRRLRQRGWGVGAARASRSRTASISRTRSASSTRR